MATLTTNDKRTEFETIVRGWEARWRQQQLLLWLPRGVALALAISVVITGLLRLADVMPPETTLLAAALIGIAVLVGSMMWVLRPRPQMQAVRQFERDFGLQERISTALELLAGRIRAHDEITAHQLEDAYARARVIDPRTTIPLRARWREWAALLPVMVIFALGVFVAMQPEQESVSPATAQAIDEAADELRDMMETVATDTTLDAAARDSLLETLETSLESLTEEPLSAEEAFAALSNTEAALRNQAGLLRNDAQTQQEALDAAAEELQDALEPENQSEANLEEMLQRMADQAPDVQGQQAAQMAEAMQRAAEMLQESNPSLAENLQDAARSLTEEQREQLQQQLQQAVNQAQESQTQTQQQQQTAENLETAAQQSQEARENIAQSEQGETNQSQPGEQPGEEGGESPSEQNGEQQNQGSERQPGEEGSESGESQGGESGNPQPSNEGDPTGQIRDMPPEQGGEGETAADQGSNSAGAGDSSNQTPGQPFAGGDNSDQQNNPDGTGETEFEPIFAPQRLNTQGNEDIELESGDNAPIVEGNLQQNPLGQASVPYNQVFQSYSDAASRALNSGYVPLGLRDVVQDYFTSLEPK
jgi:hypothetical protein